MLALSVAYCDFDFLKRTFGVACLFAEGISKANAFLHLILPVGFEGNPDLISGNTSTSQETVTGHRLRNAALNPQADFAARPQRLIMGQPCLGVPWFKKNSFVTGIQRSVSLAS